MRFHYISLNLVRFGLDRLGWIILRHVSLAYVCLRRVRLIYTPLLWDVLSLNCILFLLLYTRTCISLHL